MTPLEYGEALIATAEKWQAKITAPEPHQTNEAGEWIGEDGKTILDDRTGKPKRNPIADKRPYPRGKVHAVIGGSVEDAMRTPPSWLQWGRGLSTPEVTTSPRFFRNSKALQWGRGLSTPEVLRGRQLVARFTGFNGAGVFRPRK